MYFFIDHSITPNYDFKLPLDDDNWEVEVLRPTWFFCASQRITLGKLKEYFTPHAISKLEGDGFVKINRQP
jgi:hypothetical protein